MVFLKEVLTQNPSYQISKHHPKLCLKDCPSSRSRQINIASLWLCYSALLTSIVVKMSAIKCAFLEREYWRSKSNLPYHKKLERKTHKGGKTTKSLIACPQTLSPSPLTAKKLLSLTKVFCWCSLHPNTKQFYKKLQLKQVILWQIEKFCRQLKTYLPLFNVVRIEKWQL